MVAIAFLDVHGEFKSLHFVGQGFGGIAAGTLGYSDVLGKSLASAGDLDGDGVGDLLAGRGVSNARFPRFWVLFLNAQAQVRSLAEIAHPSPPPLGSNVNSSFGEALSLLGDLDGDGVPEIAVGDPEDNGTFPSSKFAGPGAVWIGTLYPDGSAVFRTRIGLEDLLGRPLTGKHRWDSFGWALAGLGDLDGDGVGDLAVGAFGDGTVAPNHGAVYILFLNQDGTFKTFTKIAALSGGPPPPVSNTLQLGVSLTPLGDLDGDGVVDLGAGATVGNLPTGQGWGALFVFFLRPDGTAKSYRIIGDEHSRGNSCFRAQLQRSDFFGFSATLFPERAADGTRKIVVGAAGRQFLGGVFVLHLSSQERE